MVRKQDRINLQALPTISNSYHYNWTRFNPYMVFMNCYSRYALRLWFSWHKQSRLSSKQPDKLVIT